MITANVITNHDNGAGLQQDAELLSRILIANGILPKKVHFLSPMTYSARGKAVEGYSSIGEADINIFLETINVAFMRYAPVNVLVPNLEYTAPEFLRMFNRFDSIWCKTRQTYEILIGRGQYNAALTGWLSKDRLDESVPRENRFLHVAGKSPLKGTQRVLDTWRQYPDLPPLSVFYWKASAPQLEHPPSDRIVYYSSRVDDEFFTRELNACRYHIQPSECEGFGHCLWESLSTGNHLFTLGAPPMNEVYAHKIPARQYSTRNGVPLFTFNPEDFYTAYNSAFGWNAQNNIDDSAVAIAAYRRGCQNAINVIKAQLRKLLPQLPELAKCEPSG